jgi:hypothetical protein
MKKPTLRNLLKTGVALGLTAGISVALADGPTTTAGGIGSVADTIVSNFSSVAKFLTASFYLLGLGFVGSSLFNFRKHKDAPQQIPVTTPIALMFIGAAFLFTPSLFSTAGYTLFSDGGSAAGVSGIDNFQGS